MAELWSDIGRPASAPEAPLSWPVARYRLVSLVKTALSLPDYAGSMLRGVFGHSLRQLACLTRQDICDPCPLLTTCPYTLIFEAPAPAEHQLQNFSAVPNAYVIEPPPWGRRLYEPGAALVFEMVLFGQALEKLPLVILAWQRALARGLGDGTAELTDMLLLNPQGEESVFDQALNRVRPHEQRLRLPPLQGTADFGLNFITPLRLQENGRVLPPERVTAKVLLMALARRVSLLLEFHAGIRPDYDFPRLRRMAEEVGAVNNLKWRHWERWSNRQNKKMTLNGLVGEVRFSGVPLEFQDHLRLGQWAHIGKNATFGLGRYLLEGFS
jgi:hypothetical protein